MMRLDGGERQENWVKENDPFIVISRAKPL